MIVASHDEYTAVWRAAVSVAVFECIAGTIHARAFAVPDAEHAFERLVRIGFDLLRTEDRRRCEILVDRRQKLDVALIEKFLGTPQLLIVCAERRPPAPRRSFAFR